MRDKKKNIMFVITAIVVIIALIVLIIIRLPHKAENDNKNTEMDPVNISIRDDTINNNPLDYSDLEPGTEFYDEFWHGTVTIIGKQSEVDYDEMIKNAHGRLITTQNGMFIYVDRNSKDADKLEESDQKSESVEGSAKGEEVAGDPENEKFYAETPQVDIENISAVASNSGSILPSCGWSGIRFAAKQYLNDIGLSDVTVLTVKDNTQTASGLRTGFQCSMDKEQGTIGIYFNQDNCMWRFVYTKSGSVNPEEGYTEYNPVCFVTPPSRQAACDELNKIIGYERFTVKDAEADILKAQQKSNSDKQAVEEEIAKQKEAEKKTAGAVKNNASTKPANTTKTPTNKPVTK